MINPESGQSVYDPTPAVSLRRGIQDSTEFRVYIDEMLRRLPQYSDLAAGIPAEAPGSVEWLKRIGAFWVEAREQQGLTIRDVAQRIGVETDAVRFLEFGMGYPELGIIDPNGQINPGAVVESDLARNYAGALGRPELFEKFREQFGPPQAAK